MTWQVGACKRARASVSSSKFPRELPSTPPCSQHHPSLSRSNFPQLRKRCYDRSRAERYHRPGNFQEPSSSLSSQADFAISQLRDIHLSLRSSVKSAFQEETINAENRSPFSNSITISYPSSGGEHVRLLSFQRRRTWTRFARGLQRESCTRISRPLAFQTPRVTIRSIYLPRAFKLTRIPLNVPYIRLSSIEQESRPESRYKFT